VVGAQVNGVPNLTIRGIGTNDFGIGADPAVAFFVDGVYAGRTGQVAAGLFDIERVEIIKGPQGSLFGRSAAAGAISIITAAPADTFKSSGEVEIGTRQAFRARASITGPIVGDTLLFRLSAMHNRRDGYNKDALDPARDAFDGIEDTGVRGSLRWVKGGTTVTLAGDYVKRRVRGNGFQSALPASLTGFPLDPFGPVYSDLGTRAFSNLDTYSAALTIVSELSDTLSLNAISAFRGYKWSLQEDDDGTAFNVANSGLLPEKSKSYSQEVRLDYRDGPISVFWGASIAREEASTVGSNSSDLKQLFDLGIVAAFTGDPSLTSITVLGLPDVATPFQELSFGKGRFDNLSLYSEVNFAASDQINLIAGLRWSRDKKRWTIRIPPSRQLIALGLADDDPSTADILPNLLFPTIDPAFPQQRNFDALQPRIVAQFRPAQAVMFYLSASRGYKPGGFNSFGNRPAFEQESVWNYEAGVKSDLFGRRLRLNLAVFRYDYSQLQVTVADSTPPPQLRTVNAGSARGKGVEAEIIVKPLKGLEIGASATGLIARYRESANPLAAARLPQGNRLSRAPAFQGNVHLQYAHDIGSIGELEWFALARHQSRIFFDPLNLPTQTQKAYTLVDASIRWSDPSARFSVSLFGENITNERYLTNTGGLGEGFGFPITQRGEPRRFGVRFMASM
jgi:iron complex outermembrane receptor protein